MHKHKNCCDMSAGKQAEVLNILLEDLLEGHAVSETKLKEVLGHTPIQVLTLVCSLRLCHFPMTSKHHLPLCLLMVHVISHCNHSEP